MRRVAAHRTIGLAENRSRGDDLALYLDVMNRAVAATRLEDAEKLRACQEIQNDVENTLGDLGPIDKARYMFSAMALPAVSAMAAAEARAVTDDDSTMPTPAAPGPAERRR